MDHVIFEPAVLACASQAWLKKLADEKTPIHEALKLPEPNNFIPTDFTVKANCVRTRRHSHEHAPSAAEHKALQAWAKTNGVTELMIPRDIRVVEALPVLGTGKLDYVTMGEMAALSPMTASGEQESVLEVADES